MIYCIVRRDIIISLEEVEQEAPENEKEMGIL